MTQEAAKAADTSPTSWALVGAAEGVAEDGAEGVASVKEGVKSVDEVPLNKGLPRGFDVIMSLMGLIILSPLLLAAGMTVLLTSRGGALFRQHRVGRYGELFVLYKLRTMKTANEGPQVTSGDDVRITRVGRFLRKTKLDELPTLWNVLKGEMALVGPRPEVPRYVDLQNPLWRTVLAVRPGITDPVTVRLRNEEALLRQIEGEPETYYVNNLQPLKLQGYVAYLKERNWRTDLKVLGRTATALFTTKTDGLTEENNPRDISETVNNAHRFSDRQ